MIPVVLALGSALAYSASDYIGGFASRSSSALKVVLWSHLSSVLLLALAIPLLPAAHASADDWMWGAISGLGGLAGIVLLYAGLGGGPMAIVSPISAVVAAVLPVGVGIAQGAELSALHWLGIIAGLSASALLGLGHDSTVTHHRDPIWLTVTYATGSGVALGLFFTALAQASSESGLLPLVAVRAVTITLALVAVVVISRRVHWRDVVPGQPLLASTSGWLDMVGNALYLLALVGGSLPVVMVLTALYPGGTVALARIGLGERLTRAQLVGVGLALLAVASLAVAKS